MPAPVGIRLRHVADHAGGHHPRHARHAEILDPPRQQRAARPLRLLPDCGARLWHEAPDSDYLSIKAGSLDEPVDMTKAIHIWTSRKLPGVVVPPGAQQYPEEPPD
jgi:hypothetical protein